MSKKTRRHIWPVSLVMSIAIVGALAAFIVLATNPGSSSAHGGTPHDCSDLSSAAQGLHDAFADPNDPKCSDTGNGDGTNGNGDGDGTPADATFRSSSTSANANVKLTLAVTLTDGDVEKLASDGGSIELYLEDDFGVPDSIDRNDVYFTVSPRMADTGDGGRVRAQYGVVVNDGDYYGGDDDWAIQVFLPDLQATVGDGTTGGGFQGATTGDTITMVITTAAGIKNPTEAGTHSVGYRVLGVNDDPDKGTADNIQDVEIVPKADPVVVSVVETVAKISLSADNGGRGKEVTITGSGFNNGTEAEAFVLVSDDKPTTCMALIDDSDSESLGTADVGTDDKFSIVFTVHQDEFDAGMVNWICARDSESEGGNRYSSDVDSFDLKDSLSITPATVTSGDEVTLKPRDFDPDATLESVYLGGTEAENTLMCCATGDPVQKDGSDYVFDMPGRYSGSLHITVEYSDNAKASATITVEPSSLTLSQTEVAPNQAVVISGSGFSDNASILTSMILIDGKKLEVDDAGTEGTGAERHVVTTSSGQFTATVNIWHDGAGNPALDADEYTIKVTDSSGYEGKTKITISEPTIMVTPQVAGPRDYIVISGANWPVTTSEDDHDVSIEVDDKTRSASIDSTGRFNYKYRLSGGIDIGKEHDIEVTFTSAHGDKIEEETTFSVPSSNVVITPAAAAPGETIDLEISGMPIGELVDEVTIDGGNRLGGTRLNTDRNGDVTITGILVPYAEPGFYPVKIVVGTGGSKETAIVQLEILAEGTVAGVATAVGDALADVGDNLVVVWHFNTVSKEWTFYDPRPEAAEFNTLSALIDGEAYQVLVSADVTGVVLNNKTRNLTCSGDNCWNQLVW